jgi:hypothetical protein
MHLPDLQGVTCGNCGHVFTHMLAMERCPCCGYCSYNVAEFDKRLRPVIESVAYRSQLADARYPEDASRFICTGMLAEVAGRHADAGWTYLWAAWVLDGDGKGELARAWHDKAADTFVALLSKGQLFGEQPGAFAGHPGEFEIVVTDCLRQAGRWAEALQVIERGLSQSYEDDIHKRLARQRALIQRRDAGPVPVKLTPTNEYQERPVSIEEIDELIGSAQHGWFEARWFREKFKPGDTVIEFCTPRSSWQALAGRAGYQIVRDGKVIATLITAMN